MSATVALQKKLFLCTSSSRTPPRFRMNETEAEEFLHHLVEGCVIVPVGDDTFCTDPHSVVNSVHLKLGLPPIQRGLPQLVEQRKELRETLAEARKVCIPKTIEAIKKEKEFWGFTAVLSGLQMTALAYLTFLVYGWDVMEPVTFFITSGTALVAYGYFLYFNVEHSYEAVDDNIVESSLESELRTTNLNLSSILADLERIQEIDRIVPDDDEEYDILSMCGNHDSPKDV